jgi:hypothetical protein
MAVTIGISLAIEMAIYLASDISVDIAIDIAIDIAVEIANDLTIVFAIDIALHMAIDIAIDMTLLDFCGRIFLVQGGSCRGMDKLYQISAAGRNLLSEDQAGSLHPGYHLRAPAAVNAQKPPEI